MKRLFSKLKSSGKIIKIIFKFEPIFVIFSFIQIFIKIALPFLNVYFPKLFIELLLNQSIEYFDVAKYILFYAAILIILNVLNSIITNRLNLHADIFAKKIKNKIGNVAMNLKYQDIENNDIQDLMKLAKNASSITESLLYIQNIIVNLATIIGFAYLILRLEKIFIFLIVLTLTVKVITTYLEFRHNKKLRLLLATNSRHIEYLFDVAFTNNGTAKEIRVNNLDKWYMNQNKKYRDEMVSLQYKSFKLYAFDNILNEIVLAFETFVVLYFLVTNFIEGQITLADFSLYFSAITTLTINITNITEQLGNYNQQVMNLNDYLNLNVLFEKEHLMNNENIYFDKNNVEIEFKNVSFTYPNTHNKVLSNINIKIKNHEKLAIIGLNGSGKTTFIKLLCKFYQPDSGTITLNGIDIFKIPNDIYYKIIASCFQDYINFAFPIKENITMQENVPQKIDNILKDVNLDKLVNSLPKKEETYLNKIFDHDGIELSGGENQKLAIGRALFKNSPIVILDEPTANLDPIAEKELYEYFIKMCQNKTTILISHRLAATRIADNIAVFVNGEIVEYGPFKKLIQENGIYKEMFDMQSKYYVDN